MDLFADELRNMAAGTSNGVEGIAVPGGRINRKARPYHKPSTNRNACMMALPNELLTDIAAYLHTRKDLFHLGMVNRTFSNIALPMVYAKGIEPRMSAKSRAAFSSRICKDLTLAKLVTCLQFRYAFTKPTKYQRGTGPNGEAPGTLVLDERLAARYDKTTIRELQSLAATVEAATNVQALCIEDDSYRFSDMHRDGSLKWLRLLRSACLPTARNNGEAQPFQHLNILSLRLAPAVSSHVRLPDFSEVIHLPCLEQLFIGGIFQSDAPTYSLGEPKSSNIKKLVIDDAFVHWEFIAKLVECCRTLWVFHYTYVALAYFPMGHDPRIRNEWAPHSWANIGRALQTQKGSLKVLELGYMVHPSQLVIAATRGHPVFAWHIGTLGLFADFDHLRELRVPIDALVPSPAAPNYLVGQLPVGLDTLSVRCTSIDELHHTVCLQHILALMKSKKQVGSKLRGVHLSLTAHVPAQQYPMPVWCNEVGVKLMVTRSVSPWKVGRRVYYSGCGSGHLVGARCWMPNAGDCETLE